MNESLNDRLSFAYDLKACIRDFCTFEERTVMKVDRFVLCCLRESRQLVKVFFELLNFSRLLIEWICIENVRYFYNTIYNIIYLSLFKRQNKCSNNSLIPQRQKSRLVQLIL